jgi:hypothetical protein
MKWFGLLLGVWMLAGCSRFSVESKGDACFGVPNFVAEAPAELDEVALNADRKLVWNADLSVDVRSVSNATARAVEMVKELGGYVEDKTLRRDEYARLVLRVPARSLKGAMGHLETLGEVTRRNLSSYDVTEEYIDVESRLENKKVLRDRLKKLLDRATEIKDVLAIEKEVNRVQSDIESMERRIRSLSGEVDYATIELTLDRKKIYGPLGLVFKWTGDLLEKLFFIQK